MKTPCPIAAGHIAAAILTLAGLSIGTLSAAQQPAMPSGMTHDEHLAQMKKRGALAMGFDQDKTTHHFRLTASGGALEVAANDPADNASREGIRTHLKEIAAAFAQGDFQKPFLTHDETPPGVPTMQRLKARITYAFERTDRGGRVRIATSSAEAVAAIHDFLRYQITEHATGDPLTVQK